MGDGLSITVGTGMPDDQLSPGNYPATLVSVTERSIDVKGESRDVFEWAFAVPTQESDGSPGEPIKVTGLSSQMTGPKSKTAAFLVALLGPSAVQPGATFTMNDLVGKECLIQTELNDSGYAKVVGAVPMPVSVAPRPSNRAAVAQDTVGADTSAAAPVPAPVPGPAAKAGEDEDDLPF